jgi:hypothetical protein
MKIILNEHQYNLLEKIIVNSSIKDDIKNVDNEKEELENYIEEHGEFMYDITNGKEYLVQYLKALSDLVGKKYAVCAPVEKDGTYGAFYVKPYDSFRAKSSISPHMNTQPMRLHQNMYQKLRDRGELD